MESVDGMWRLKNQIYWQSWLTRVSRGYEKEQNKTEKILGKIKRDCSVLVEGTNLNEEFKIREKPTFAEICPLSA